MSFTRVSIEPYFDESIPNMGLEKYGMTTFPDTELEEYISQDENGRFVTGLDIYSRMVEDIEDAEEKEAKIKEITDIITRLEKIIGKGKLDPANADYWLNFKLHVTNGQKTLDLKRPIDEIIYHAIKAGGFSEVATSYEEAQKSNKIYKFYLKRDDEEAAVKTRWTKLIDKANGLLVDLVDEDPYKLFLMGKILLTPSNEFKRTTVADIVYGKLRQFVAGEIVKDNKKDTVKQFLELYKADKETLTINAYVIDALYHKMLMQEPDGHFYNKQTQTRCGKNVKELINYFKNPVNQSELDNISTRVEKKWNS